MPPTDIHFEESHTTEIPIVRLIWYFSRFFKPYWPAIACTLLLALSAVGAELLLPHFLKLAMDRHLTVAARRVDITPADFSTYSLKATDLVSAAEGTAFFMLPDKLNALQGPVMQALGKAGRISGESYYFTTKTPGKMLTAREHIKPFYTSGEYLFIPYDALKDIPYPALAALRADDFRGIIELAQLFLYVLLGGFILTFTQMYLVEYTSQKIMHDIRMNVFGHLQQRSMSFFTKNPVGRLVTRATNDVQNLHEMFSALFANIAKDICMIVGIIVVLFIVSWKLALVSFSLLPLLVLGTFFFNRLSRSAFREVRIKVAALNARAQENLSGISVVKAFGRELHNIRQFNKLNHENYRANMKQTLVFAVFNPLVDLCRFSAIALIIWYGGMQTMRDAVSLGTLVLFLYYMRMFFRPIQDLAEKYNILQSAMASLERLYLLLHDTGTINDPPEPRSLPAPGPGPVIEFENVSFSYQEGEPVLQDVSFTVEKGETVAIVGLTGAGKSTIINLLERFYDIQSGSIRINGVDVHLMQKNELRKNMSLVLQDVFLFAGTLRSNLTLGKEYDDEAVLRALQITHADRLERRFENGLAAKITEGGKTLSAGERQLVSFARAVLCDTEILVLDEATSSIDPVTESLIQDALKHMLSRRTSLVIAHRLSTIRNADKIIVLHKGAIHEQGTHDQLMQQQGLYYRLSQLQENGVS